MKRIVVLEILFEWTSLIPFQNLSSSTQSKVKILSLTKVRSAKQRSSNVSCKNTVFSRDIKIA